MKKFLKNTACRVWMGVTAVVLVIAVLVNIFSCTTFKNAFGQLFGEGAVEILGDDQSVYEKDFATKAEALQNGNEVSKRICEEGFTLLKNRNNALPLKEDETKVSVFGKNSADMAIGGSGSGGSLGAKATTIFESLRENGFTYNKALVDFYNDETKSGAGRDANPPDLDKGNEVTLSEGETPLASYSGDLWNSCKTFNDVAIIVITRIGGEGFDMPRSADGTHFLQFSVNERDLIEKVKTLGFQKTVLVLNVATSFELKAAEEDDGIDAILWTGFAGGNGMAAFGEVLRGKTAAGELFSPSGKTVDTFAADFTKNPTWENMGAALGGDYYFTTTVDVRTGKEKQVKKKAYFVDYEEGIYVGYRYYETAYAEAQKGNYDFDYGKEVVYPFGFGLSYTRFSWELLNEEELDGAVLGKNTSLTFRVKVTNEGNYPGRDVVQLYVTPPYTDGGIEKSAKILIGFAKTKLLPVGGEETLEITVDSPYAFASYDYKDANKNDIFGYEVEQGAYAFSLSSDAHTPVKTVNATVQTDLYYENDPACAAKTTVKNLYTDNADASLNSDTELNSILSRADFEDTAPKRRTDAEKNRNGKEDWIKSIEEAESVTNRPAQNTEMPVTGKNNGMMLIQLRGAEYDDEEWDRFLDQLTVSEMLSLVNQGAFRTGAITRLGVPPTTAADGPVGFCNFVSSNAVYDTCKYPCQSVIASTWNVERLYEMGVSVGNEGLVGDEREGGLPYTGWYAPGLNLHRTPFGGRNFEYYSEDAYLSGMLTAAIVKGAATKGVYVDMKHFALNEQETHRSSNGLLTWATEQSMREVYLKAFEIAIKESMKGGVKALGVMSSFNRIGERWAGGDYRLLTTILREEWGFEGLVICDFNTCAHMVNRDMHYAGGDLNLEMIGVRVWDADAKNATDVTVLREACKNILYVVANSNAMRGDFIVHTAPWQIVMIVCDVLLFAGFTAWGVVVGIRAVKGRKPEETDGSSASQE